MPPMSIPSGHLSRARQDLILTYIQENLPRDFGLDELASHCGLTRFQFAARSRPHLAERPISTS